MRLSLVLRALFLAVFVFGPMAFGEVEVDYFAVFMEGAKVGYMVSSREVDDVNVVTSIEVDMTVSRFGIPVNIHMRQKYIETISGKPLGFESELNASGMAMITRGVIKEDGQVEVVNSMGGMEQASKMQWPEGAMMAEATLLFSKKMGLENGTNYSLKVFDPSILQAIDVHVAIGEREEVDLLGRIVNLTQVTSTIIMPGAGPVVSIDYVDDENKLQKQRTNIAGINVEIVSCAREFAFGENDVLDLVDKMFVSSPKPLGDENLLKSVRYVLLPKAEDIQLDIPTIDNQSVQRQGGRVVIIVEPVSAPKGAKFPYTGEDQEILDMMNATRYLQSDDERVIKLAKEAIGDTKDALQAVRKIESFVAYYMVNKGLSVGYASAVEVAESRQGDCTEYAVLSAALCRAVGIPSRVVMGIAYIEKYMEMENRFGGHAWTEAYVGDKWVGIDAAFKGAGLGGYGPGHIAFEAGNGNPEDFFSVAGIMGQFEIEKIEVTKK
jgi:hypothetical protein